ncbi:MAG: hypothetical protein PUB21_09150 [Bacteroidales bacterium]|nr:hypothetical protein [Bacteroidales bacterium]
MKKNFLYTACICATLLLSNCSVADRQGRDGSRDLEQIVRRGNVVYDMDELQTGHPHIPLLVSNGIVGGCFDHMGFQSRPNTGTPEGRTVFGYIGNYERNASSRQIQFPLAVISAGFADGSSVLNLMDSKNYRQELDIYTGILTTEYDLFGETKIQALAHQAYPNLFVMQIDRKAASPEKELVLKINCETSACQNRDFLWPVQPEKVSVRTEGNKAYITSTTNIATTEWIVDGDNPVTFKENILYIPLHKENNTVKIAVKRPDTPAPAELFDKSFAELKKSHEAVWADAWRKSWVDLPDDRAQKIWTRMKYYAVSHFPVIEEKPLIPTGLNGNIWGFTFPQDVYYVAENMPRLGFTDRSAKALDYWLHILPEVQKYTKRIMGVDGAFYPWTPPYTDWDSYEKDSVVGADSYELHNPAYVLAIAWHHYQRSGNKEDLQRYFPIIEEVSRFYVDISEPNAKGTYDVYHDNSRGQDEASTTDGKLRNLLCASYSAEYALRTYLEAAALLNAGDAALLSRAKEIYAKGYDREPLLRPEGWYATYLGDTRPAGMQKHPVQLNPIAYLPMPEHVYEGAPAVKAWQHRYQLTDEANKPITLGWTIGEFALASCRMRDAAAVEKDLSAIQLCRGADPRWIQFYESSFWEGWHLSKSYYFPMMALYLQMYTDALVQDWRGYVDLFPCLLEGWGKDKFSFHGIHVKDGAIIDGRWDNGKFEVTILPGASAAIELMVTPETGTIRAEGQKEGPATFKSGEKVTLAFKDAKPIRLSN